MRRGLVLTALLVIAAGCAASRPLADASLTPILRPHDAIYRPPGEGPFPAVLVLHGCLGVRSKDTRWAESLRDDGYVALVVDSMTGRGLTTLDQRRNVCTGWTLWGGTRAADVLASLRTCARCRSSTARGSASSGSRTAPGRPSICSRAPRGKTWPACAP